MPSRLLPWHRESDASQQLPFTNSLVTNAEFSNDNQPHDHDSDSLPRSHPIRAHSNVSGTLSSSYTIRSFAHQAPHSVSDNPQYSSHGVRERTQELASYALDSASYHSVRRRGSVTDQESIAGRSVLPIDTEGRSSLDSAGSDFIEENIPTSSDTVNGPNRRYRGAHDDRRSPNAHGRLLSPAPPAVVVQDTEETPLLPKARLSRTEAQAGPKSSRSSTKPKHLKTRFVETISAGRQRLVHAGRSVTDPKNYTKDAIYTGAVASMQTGSAVFLGLLLNILDALSYGYILFPLGSPIFSQTGPDGISIFFVSCVVSQLCYSLGLSIFRGGVGSEMIEVVPFFHRMAYSIMARMKGASPEAIIATTIVSYCLSSIITGLIFLALGTFKLGNLVSFFPQHILIGCIGGVGFFLVMTGIEVSARLEGNLNYDLDTIHKLFASDTVYLWILPLVLSLSIMIMERRYKSPFLLPGFFVAVFAVFYLIVKAILRLDLEVLRGSGWIFEAPEAGVPFYRFYSYFSEFGMPIVKYCINTIFRIQPD